MVPKFQIPNQSGINLLNLGIEFCGEGFELPASKKSEENVLREIFPLAAMQSPRIF